jgi:Fe-S-cluster containining protein
MTDQTPEFLNDMPQLAPGEKFQFRCHPGVDCFNACCSDLNLMLTPYDALRLRRFLGLSSRDFVQRHCMVSAGRDLGFPLVQMRMLDDARRSCPFVRPEGCSVYGDRPGACRTYPLGPTATAFCRKATGLRANGSRTRAWRPTTRPTTATCG